MSLYQRLFVYREREERSHLENFVTEALSDLLNRLPEPKLRDTVEYFLSGCTDLSRELEKVWPVGKQAHWTTQKCIDGRHFVDLLMEVDGRPVLIIENKIGAGFQTHQIDGKTSDDKNNSQNQLVTYGQWLAGAADADWGGALILLTHWTPAPEGFISDSGTYACRHRAVARWEAFCRRLKSFIPSSDLPAPGWAVLAGEFVEFLKEQHMSSELADGRDWAALQVYLSSADRIRNSVTEIWEAARPIWKTICKQSDSVLEISKQYGCVWKYRYLYMEKYKDCYVASGIRFPEETSYMLDVSESKFPYLFVEFGSEKEKSLIYNLKMPDGWLKSGATYLAMKELRDLSVDSDKFVQESERWVCERMSEVVNSLI